MNETRAWDVAKLALVGLLGVFEYATRNAINSVETRIAVIERVLIEKGVK